MKDCTHLVTFVLCFVLNCPQKTRVNLPITSDLSFHFCSISPTFNSSSFFKAIFSDLITGKCDIIKAVGGGGILTLKLASHCFLAHCYCFVSWLMGQLLGCLVTTEHLEDQVYLIHLDVSKAS